MSGLGPAACWLAHKRLESWSRMAKERVGAVRRAAAERNSEDNPSTPPPLTPSSVSSNTSGGGSGGSGSGSYELTTDSNSSLEVIISLTEIVDGPNMRKLKNLMMVSYLLQECNLAREPHAIQPLASVPAHTVNTEMLRGPLEVTPSPLHTHLQHQSKSFPPRLTRTPSVSSQSSVDSAPSRQSVGPFNSNVFPCILKEVLFVGSSRFISPNKDFRTRRAYFNPTRSWNDACK